MEQIRTMDDLKLRIQALEAKQLIEKNELKTHFHFTCEQLKPANLIRNSIHQLNGPKKIGDLLLKASLGLGAGYLSKKLVESDIMKPIRRLASSTILTSIVTMIVKDPQIIKSLYNRFFGSKEMDDTEESQFNESNLNQTNETENYAH